jgi:L-threonylcarbamoyladenylate synthase
MVDIRYLTPVSGSGLLSLADVAAVVAALRADHLAVLPTETGYMLAAVATSPAAVRKAFAAKRRDRANPMHVACASLAMAARYGVFDAVATDLVGRLTPGPLTVVVPRTNLLPDGLVTLRGTVGIRVPDCAATLQVIAELGRPLTATSLNRSGAEHLPVTRDELEALDWPAGETVHVVRDDSVLAFDRPSTLVGLVGDGLTVLRAGALSIEDITAGAPAGG